MPKVTSDIQKLLDTKQYRIIDTNDKNQGKTFPGEIIINLHGIILAYTSNNKKNNFNHT